MMITGLSIPVFPLKDIDTYARDYYMDSGGGVWSTKGRNGVTKLTGSITPSGLRYYTLNKRTHRADHLYRLAKSHKDFTAETSSTVAPPVTSAATLPGRTMSAASAVAGKGYLLATLKHDRLVFGTKPVFHTDETTAKAEAERVAGLTGAEVVVLKVVGKVKVQKAVWE